MTQYPVLRVLAAILKIVAAFVLLATVLVVLAIVGSGVSSPPGLPPAIFWITTLGGALLVALAGVLSTLLLYAAGEIIVLLLAIDEHLRRGLARAGEAPEQNEKR